MWNDIKTLFDELIIPDEYLDTIYSVDFNHLKSLGISGLLLDLDNTLVGRYEDEPSLKCRSWIDAAKLAGFRLCISSNSFYPNRVRNIAESLQVPAFFVAVKPLPWALNVAAKNILKLPPSQVALIGDQLFTDVLGGNLANMHTILVDPMEKERFTAKKLVRLLEKSALKSCGISMVEGSILGYRTKRNRREIVNEYH
ncbi:MAG: YqeG family HAD IIIA-type phosphatase [Candidatus Margulisiibacteriota bacterium]